MHRIPNAESRRAVAGEPPGREGAARAPGEPGYPSGLLDLEDPPAPLWCAGPHRSTGRAVAIVGARAATGYGLRIAREFARALASCGVAIVSGLARGVDAAAHRGALEAGGETIAVLAGGLDVAVPRGQRAMADEILETGALASEYAPGTPPYPVRFLERNRLIAAWAQATIVVEAAERSGALTTAAWARRLGRPLFAVPGDLDRETSRGTNALLARGALACLDAGQILRALEESPVSAAAAIRSGPDAPSVATAPPRVLAGRAGPPLEAEALRNALDGTPRTVEAIASRAGLALPRALAALLELEWSGIAERSAGPRYRKRTLP